MPSDSDAQPGDGDEDGEEWKFKSGDIVREKHAKPSPVPGESDEDESRVWPKEDGGMFD